MSDIEYTYRYSISEYSANIEIAIYDPNRWDGAGGAKFGHDANVWVVEQVYSGDDVVRFVARCSQGSIGSHSPDDAAERIDVYQQAADLARYINDAIIRNGWEATAEWLEANLPKEKITERFKYPAEVL